MKLLKGTTQNSLCGIAKTLKTWYNYYNYIDEYRRSSETCKEYEIQINKPYVKGHKIVDAYNYKGLEIQTGHYFSGKCVLFAGTLERCSRRDAMDRLFFDFGGVPVEKYAVWVECLIAARGAETTADYKKARDMEHEGIGTILTEQELFDVMDGRLIPPENPNKKDSKTTVILPSGMSEEEYITREAAQHAEFIAGKRDDYLRKRKPANNKYDVRLQDDMNLRFVYKQVDMMRTALERWGEAAQVGMAVEECAELIVALQKHTNRTPTTETLENILDEIADVEIMLAQMRLTFGISDDMLQKRIAQKFVKLEKHLIKH